MEGQQEDIFRGIKQWMDHHIILSYDDDVSSSPNQTVAHSGSSAIGNSDPAIVDRPSMSEFHTYRLHQHITTTLPEDLEQKNSRFQHYIVRLRRDRICSNQSHQTFPSPIKPIPVIPLPGYV